MFHNFFFFLTRALYEILYSRAGQATYDDMAHAHLTLATNIHSEYVILIVFFFAATLFARTNLSITLYVHRLSC